MSEAQLSYDKCYVCMKRIGSLFCHDCEKILCVQCCLDHDVSTSNIGHFVIDSQNESCVFNQKPVCTTHGMEFISFCMDCDCLICIECNIFTHYGHTLDTIMKIIDISRKNTQKTIEELKSKVKITSNMLKEIRTTKLQKLQSDYEDYIGVVSTRSPKLQQIVDEIRTKASDFCQLEMEPILEFVGRLECLRDSYTKTCTQLVHILREKNDVMFLSTNKLLQTDLDNLEEIPQMIQPKTLDAFQHGDFFNLPDLVIKEIQQKFTIG